MSNGITIEGLDELRARWRLAPRDFDYALRIAVRRAGQRTTTESKGFLPDRSPLARTIKSQAIGGRPGVIVGSLARSEAVESIHLGRRPGNNVPSMAIARWRFKKKSLAGLSRSERAEVWKILSAIRARGTRPLPFLTGALPRVAPHVERYFSEAVETVLRKLAGK